MEDLETIGKRAYEKQMWGAYDEAISLYTNAIRRFPSDPRLYNNRCLCYLELNDLTKAMEDAEYMVFAHPKNMKSFYRKGEILVKMKQFEEAEAAFQKVLDLDQKCEDARVQIREAQISQILKGLTKYNRNQAAKALNLTGNIQKARAALMNGLIQTRLKELENIVYISDDDDDLPTVINNQNRHDPFMDPSNPFRSVSLWVGCISKGVTEAGLHSLFSKYGRVKSVKIIIDKLHGFAFVNYFDADGPGKAMKKLQGHMLQGQAIIIKYPDNVFLSASNKQKFK